MLMEEFFLLNLLHQFCDNCKIPSCTYYLKEAEMEITMFARFKEYHENHEKILRVYMVWGMLSQS